VPGVRTAVLAAAVIAVGCAVAAIASLATGASPGTARAVLAGTAAGSAFTLLALVLAASAAAREAAGHARAARVIVARGQADVQRMAEMLLRGDRPVSPDPPPAKGLEGGPFGLLMGDLEQSRYAARQALLRVAEALLKSRPGQQVEILVNLAGRMQSLVHREIELLDALENQVEDPELLKGLYAVDHLATRMRRQSESLAVLGGTASRRQWGRPVSMQEVLRAAVAEIEQYPRVKVESPAEGLLRGTAVADVIHLVAELAENAARFSGPRTLVLLRSQAVAAGVAVEVEDRGLGMTPQDRRRMNDLLADPGRTGIDEPLRDGRIGLYVVAVLAGRHGIHVELRPSIYGGTSAAVIIPRALLEGHDDRGPASAPAAPRQRELARAGAEPAPAEAPASPPWSPAALGADGPRGIFEPAPELPRQHAAPGADRPPLPVRQPQASLAPGLRGTAGSAGIQGATAGQARQGPGHAPGLMADFLSGVRQSQEPGRAATD
jgi:signal transduction histidine kinase